MYRYVILSIYPLLFAACALAAYQTRKIARNFPSESWTLRRRLMLGFAMFQLYGMVRVFTVQRTFTWADPIYVIGLLIFFIGLNRADSLLLRDARGIRAKAIKVFIPPPPVSGDMPPEYWRETFTSVVRENIKPEYLVEVEPVTNLLTTKDVK